MAKPAGKKGEKKKTNEKVTGDGCDDEAIKESENREKKKKRALKFRLIFFWLWSKIVQLLLVQRN